MQAAERRKSVAHSAAVLRRALQLQPHLVYMDLHLDRYYENENDLKRYTARLADQVAEHGAKSETYFLLGYLRFQTGAKIQVPFECFLIFSSNLNPDKLGDEAFLRRLEYKVFMAFIWYGGRKGI